MTVGAEFEICLAPEFWDQLLRLPRNVGKSIAASALPRLRTQPDQADPPAIKKLVGWEGLWRYRKGAYRLIYQVDTEAREVTLRLAGHRGTIYDELGHVPDEGPSIRVLRSMPDLVAEERTAELVDLDHEVTEGTASEPADITGEIEERLPEAIGTEMLEECRVAPDYRRVFSGVETAGELMALAPKVPEDQLCRVLSRLYPPAVSELFDGPRHVVESDEDVESALEEGRPIESFLLRLDEQQKVLVDRFEQPSPTGPWIVKGGPGTGKSTIALYCIRNLLKPEQVDYLAEPRPMQVLFTTYTKSLTALARHLLSHLRAGEQSGRPNLSNVDQVAYHLLPSAWRERRIISDRALLSAVRSSITRAGSRLFSGSHAEFIAEEIEWVIFGNVLESIDEYLAVSRRGRGRALAERQRREVWNIYERLRDYLKEQDLRTFKQTIAVASYLAKPAYDYVFIDEAQDLTPAAIRMCVKLSRDPKHVFITADLNQSIYGHGISWASIDTELNFRGRSNILRKNYRTTVEICEAIDFLSEGSVDEESQLHVEEAVDHGEFPVFASYETPEQEISFINRFLMQSLLGERLSPSCAAVLCRTKVDCDEIAEALDDSFMAQPMRSSDVTFSHRGVKVMTIHAAKGLEFPVVVVARANQEEQDPTSRDEEPAAQLRRLFLVACSRAMRRLAVTARTDHRLPLLSGVGHQTWDVWEK